MEHSAFQAVDFALSSYIADIYSTAQSGIVGGPAAWQRLLEEKPQNKITRGGIFEPLSVLKGIQSGRLHVVNDVDQKGDIRLNAPRLPLIHYGRRPGMQTPFSSAADFKQIKLELDSGQHVDVTLIKVTLSYQLMLMANDIPTLDAMQMAFAIALRSKTRFQTIFQIGDESLDDIWCQIERSDQIVFEDASIEREQGRVHAVTTDLMIESYAIAGDLIDLPEDIRWTFAIEHRTDCEGGVCRA